MKTQKDLGEYIAKKREIPIDCRRVILWLMGKTEGFTESVSVNFYEWSRPSPKQLDIALCVLKDEKEFNRIFKSVAPAYSLSNAMYYSQAEGTVMAVSLYKSLEKMRFLKTPLSKDFLKIPIRPRR